jgi:hypothetical protein
VNLASVAQLLDSGPLLVRGIIGAYNPALRAIDLRQSFSPLVGNILDPILGAIGLDPICVPADVACDNLPPIGLAASAPVPAVITPTTSSSPVDSVLGLLSAPTEPRATAEKRSLADRVAGLGHFFSDAGANLLGVGS